MAKKTKKRLKSPVTDKESERIRKAVTRLKDSETRTHISQKKERFIVSFCETLCNVSETCQLLKISRRCFYNWLESDPTFAVAIGDAREQVLDKLESAALNKAIVSKDTTMLIFLLKTIGVQRGYQENKQVKVTVTNKQSIKLGGNTIEF